jgi:hypothetical protein
MFDAPYPPYDPIDKAGFSYETVLKRWPVILTGVIDRLHRINHELTVEVKKGDSVLNTVLEEKIAEGKEIISRISGLKYRMGGDKTLDTIAEDDEADAEIYNSELRRLAADAKDTWYTAPWLYAECYLYRLLRSYVSQTTHWSAYDPFFTQKQETLQGSGVAIYQIATTMHELESQKSTLRSDPDKLDVLFKEMIQICLWWVDLAVCPIMALTSHHRGNATVSSVITDPSINLRKLQS